MPILKNPKQETFAQGLASGISAAAAYAAAGFKGDRRAASKLRHRDDIGRRVVEIARVRSDIAEKAQALALERAVEKRALSIEYVLDTLMDNVEICMGRKSIPTKLFMKGTETVAQVDITKHDPAGVVASCTLLGKHLGMFTERSEIKVEDKSDVADPQVRLQLAREILFMIAKAEHGVRYASKVIEAAANKDD